MTSTFDRLDASDRRLRVTCKDISLTELRLKKTQQTIDALLEYVSARNNKGERHNRKKPTIIGLSANQVGIMKRMCIVDLAVRKRKYNDVHVLVNPHVFWKSKTTSLRKEGCVNLPNIWGYVPRSQKVDVSFLDRWGNSYTMRALGWAATLIQHEVDHLDGHLFIDHLKDPTKALLIKDEDLIAYKKNPKAWSKFVDVSALCYSPGGGS